MLSVELLKLCGDEVRYFIRGRSITSSIAMEKRRETKVCRLSQASRRIVMSMLCTKSDDKDMLCASSRTSSHLLCSAQLAGCESRHGHVGHGWRCQGSQHQPANLRQTCSFTASSHRTSHYAPTTRTLSSQRRAFAIAALHCLALLTTTRVDVCETHVDRSYGECLRQLV